MSGRGGIRVARQHIHAGRPRAGRIVTIEPGDTTLQVIDSPGGGGGLAVQGTDE